jgi:hypothetical protein
VGSGSLCRRERTSEIVSIVRALADDLPSERFHLWGVKLGALEALREAGLRDRVSSLLPPRGTTASPTASTRCARAT